MKNKNKIISPEEKTLLWGNNLWYFSYGMLGPLFAIFAERVGGDILNITWAWAAYLVSTGIFTVIFGKLSDKTDHKKTMIAGYFLSTIFTFGYLLVSNTVDLLLVQVGLGLSLALANPSWYALYDKFSKEKHDGYIWGQAIGQADIFMGVAVVAGGYIASIWSFDALFVMMGVVQLLATLAQARIFLYK